MDEDKIADIAICLVIIAIIVLKITNVIKVSWLILLSPILAALGLGIILALFLTIAIIINIWRAK